MKRVVLDTNVLIPFLQNPEAFASALLAYDRIVIVPTVAGEYLAGITDTKQGKANRRAFVDFLSNPAVDELPITTRTGEIYARTYKALRAQGTPIPTNDIWIAASAIAGEADLFTRDGHSKMSLGLILFKHSHAMKTNQHQCRKGALTASAALVASAGMDVRITRPGARRRQ